MKYVHFVQVAALTALTAVASPTIAQETEADPHEVFKKLDGNGDGQLTPAEVSPDRRGLLKRLVEIGDRDGNGQLNEQEFSRAFEYRDLILEDERPVSDSPSRPAFDPKRMAEIMDRNKDGKITVDEVPDRARPLVQGLLRRAGKERGDSISVEEFLKLLPNRPQPTRQDAARRPPDGEFIKRLFERADQNGDGKLSKDEAPPKLKENFSKVDLNGDGFVDPQELEDGIRRALGRSSPTRRPQSR